MSLVRIIFDRLFKRGCDSDSAMSFTESSHSSVHPHLRDQTDYRLYLLRQLATLIELSKKEGIDILNNDNIQDKC